MEQRPDRISEDTTRELTLEDILHLFRRRFWWFFFTVLITGLITLGYLFVTTPIYESSVTMKVQSSEKASALGSIFSGGLPMAGGSSDISTEIELIKSRSNLEEVARSLNLVDIFIDPQNPLRVTESENQLVLRVVRMLDNVIQVSPVRNTSIVRIAVELPQPDLATEIANELARVYNRQLEEYARREIRTKREFIEIQLPKAEQELLDLIQQIRDFKERSGVFTLSQEAGYVFGLLASYDTEIIQKNLEIQSTSSAIVTIKDQLQKIDPQLIASQTISLNPLVSELQSKLANHNIELATLERMYPSTDPRVIQKKKQIEETQVELSHQVATLVTSQQKVNNPIHNSLLADLVSNEIRLLISQAAIDSLTQVRRQVENRLMELPFLEQQLLDLQRQMNLKEEIYILLYKNFEEAKLAEASVVGGSFIVDPAIVPTSPVKPQKMLTLAIGGVLGIFLGILLVFLIEFADKTLRTEEEIERMVNKTLPVLGRIPNYSMKQQTEVITKVDPVSIEAEAYKMAANNILFSTLDGNKILAVTSAGPAEGKTTLIANCAHALAQNGEKVLVLDLDMRKPRIEAIFRLDTVRTGVVHFFANHTPLDLLVVPVDENLDILPVGPIPPNPTSILASKKMVELLGWLSDRYDRVLIDTPPVMAAADVTLIAPRVDGVVMVTMLNKTLKPSLKAAINNLMHAKANILGFVVNNIQERSSSYYYYYQQGGKKKKKSQKKLQSKIRV